MVDNIEFVGFHQTVTRSGAITVQVEFSSCGCRFNLKTSFSLIVCPMQCNSIGQSIKSPECSCVRPCICMVTMDHP